MTPSLEYDDSQAGFSVLEILFAFLILSMLLVATIQLIIGSMKLTKRAGQLRLEASIVQDIRTGSLPGILNNVAITGIAQSKLENGWLITVSPISSISSSPNAVSPYGKLVHIQIAKNPRAPNNSQSAAKVAYESFRLVPQPLPAS